MKSIAKPYYLDSYIPVSVPANWTVVRNELLREFLKTHPVSLRWEWLFSAVYQAKGFNLEVQVLGNHSERGVAISGAVFKFNSSVEGSDSEMELMIVEPQHVQGEETVRKLTNSLFEFSLTYLDDLRSAGRSF
jgi:hypothetical protein